MPGEMWQIKINETKLIGRLDDVLYEHCHKDQIIQYWISKGRITEEGVTMVDWESHHKAMKAFGPRKHWVTKIFLGWARSGEKMQQAMGIQILCRMPTVRRDGVHITACDVMQVGISNR